MKADELMLVLQLVAQGLANDEFPNFDMEDYIVRCLGRPRANQLMNTIITLKFTTLDELLKGINNGR